MQFLGLLGIGNVCLDVLSELVTDNVVDFVLK